MNSEYEAFMKFDNELIEFPQFLKAQEAIEDSLALYRATKVAQHLLVLGESGTGKSSLCRRLADRYPRQRTAELDTCPVLYVPTPPAASISGMATAMLECLGDPWPTAGNTVDKMDRITHLHRRCGVEITLFDEAQHLHDRGQAATHYLVGDWIKSFVDKTAKPSVFLGLPRLENLLQVNEQLRRRFSRRLQLALGRSKDLTIHDECLQLFFSLGQSLPIPLDAANFASADMAMRIYYATDGRVAYVKKLLGAAFRQASRTHCEVIDRELLEDVFTHEIFHGGVGALNPFNRAFEFRRLDRGGEPFQRGDAVSAPRSRRGAAR
jgi:adenylate kinase family enzyme